MKLKVNGRNKSGLHNFFVRETSSLIFQLKKYFIYEIMISKQGAQ